MKSKWHLANGEVAHNLGKGEGNEEINVEVEVDWKLGEGRRGRRRKSHKKE
jgi:hypothetical protein